MNNSSDRYGATGCVGRFHNLGRDAIKLCFANLQDYSLQTLESHSLPWIGDDELARYKRYRNPRRSKQFLLGQALLRVALSRITEIKPQQWHFTAGMTGKPIIKSPLPDDECHFSVSHSGEHVVVGLARYAAFGIDVESCTRQRYLEKIAQRHFAPQEIAELLSLPKSQQLARFYALWTLKEAWLKAGGSQQTPSRKILHKFSFGFATDTDEIEFHVDEPLFVDTRAWKFWQLEVMPDHAIAVAINGGDQRPVRSINAYHFDSFDQIREVPLTILRRG
ncbi:MAG: 4'-phosphopantetheinyl transferase superfamily protein [Gammaproteobacteria bacterium]|nr:4'-phosphopantetheinyl transferase superfamily protein [Gammaproteobacteria bacterium]